MNMNFVGCNEELEFRKSERELERNDFVGVKKLN